MVFRVSANIVKKVVSIRLVQKALSPTSNANATNTKFKGTFMQNAIPVSANASLNALRYGLSVMGYKSVIDFKKIYYHIQSLSLLILKCLSIASLQL